MSKKIRYGDFIKEMSVNYTEINYSELTPKEGQKPKTSIKLRNIDIYRLVQPYVSVRFMDQVKALLPLALYLILFQIFMLRQSVTDATVISLGLFAVILGLMFFMEGIKQGLMPFGESIGNTLPKKVTLKVVLFIAFLLGIGVTFAEPAIGALKAAGSLVEVQKAPYLYALLNEWAGVLVLIVGAGVGIAAILGTVRFIYGWSLKPYIYATVVPTLLLTTYFMGNEDLAVILGLAWDSGAVTTGPVTVPLVLSLGIGIASAAGKGDSSLSGFGIVTLASIFPILGVMLLGLYVSMVSTPSDIIAMAQGVSLAASTIEPWHQSTPWEEIILGIRAIIPLVIFLMIVMKIVLKEKIKNSGTITYGIVLAVIGMCIFNLGLTYGLSKLGAQSGSLVPAAFNDIASPIDGSLIEALYPYGIGLIVAIGFAFVLGFGATLAEPALNALGMTVQDLTNGVFKKSTLMYAVSFGVGCGLAIGIIKIIFDIPLAYILIPLYLLALVLTFFSTEEFVNIAWDSAGVTTGPITVPLVLAMGLGFGNAVGATDGFGILSMASICPILAVLATGLYVGYKAKQQQKIEVEAISVQNVKEGI
ncbi:MAG: DUF1538 domain-containing protein [Campylobacterota bacterium]|nr:DUF1538 domain-containing protein [Campylobacterota bacterium]